MRSLALAVIACLTIHVGRGSGQTPDSLPPGWARTDTLFGSTYKLRAGFVITSGSDTVAVEYFERAAQTLSGHVFGPNGQRFRYAASLRADGTVASIESVLDWGWWTNSVLQFQGDTVRVTGNLRGRPKQSQMAIGARAMPMSLRSFALLEQLLRATPANNQPVPVRIVNLERLDTSTWQVVRTSADSATVMFPGFGDARLAIRPEGGIAGGVIPALGWSVARTTGAATLSKSAETPRRTFAGFDGCNETARDTLTRIEVPGEPVMSVATPDGCWLVTSLISTKLGWPGAIALFRRSLGSVSLARVLPLEAPALGLAVTSDGSLLAVAAGDGVVFVDLQRLIMGRTDAVLGQLRDGGQPARFYLNITADDRFLFVSDEAARSITVVDLARARESDFAATAVVGKIPVGRAPIALTFSPDQRYLYTTSQFAPAPLNWPKVCRREGPEPKPAEAINPEGAVLVIDVERAKVDPANAVIAAAPAGCNPVRLALSPAGDIAYVTARSSNALLAFDTRKLREEPAQALLGKVPVGTAPVGVAVVDGGRKIIVANSNRYAGRRGGDQYLSVIDAARIAAGSAAVLRTIPVTGLPRELTATPDGGTLMVSNFTANMLQLVTLPPR